jgi:hypothetical protein
MSNPCIVINSLTHLLTYSSLKICVHSEGFDLLSKELVVLDYRVTSVFLGKHKMLNVRTAGDEGAGAELGDNMI